ncbi:zinc finger protein 32-like [Trematomus bernacchii]|uniref:zinc finger protein 32-like n=1 Tax=Trematomus bernacchii TaxID=40690 RepID=UPI00146C7F87|nr:zinc finger protein 32-like [Trematomus bernacchii]
MCFLFPADVQQLVVVKEEVPPEQQEWSSSLDQEDPEPPPHIKEEQEELWSSQEGEQLQGLEEADIIKFTFTPVPVKSEDDEEKPQSSQLHQRQTEHLETEAEGEDCGGPEPARNSDPERHLQPETEDNPGDSSEDTEDSADWKETREPGSNSQRNEQDSVSDSEEKTFSCSVCEKSFKWRGNLKCHMRIHTGEKPFSCSVCEKSFTQRGNLKCHMRNHTGEKPFSCSVCDKRFTWGHKVKIHKCVARQSSQLHQTEENREAEPPASSSAEQEKPPSCAVSEKSFLLESQLLNHECVGEPSHCHTSNPLFDSSQCGTVIDRKHQLPVTSRIQKSLKPNDGSLCGIAFSNLESSQMPGQFGEKPFCCSVCNSGFSDSEALVQHMRIHTRQT